MRGDKEVRPRGSAPSRRRRAALFERRPCGPTNPAKGRALRSAIVKVLAGRRNAPLRPRLFPSDFACAFPLPAKTLLMDCKGEPLLGVQGAKPPGLTHLTSLTSSGTGGASLGGAGGR